MSVDYRCDNFVDIYQIPIHRSEQDLHSYNRKMSAQSTENGYFSDRLSVSECKD